MKKFKVIAGRSFDKKELKREESKVLEEVSLEEVTDALMEYYGYDEVSGSLSVSAVDFAKEYGLKCWELKSYADYYKRPEVLADIILDRIDPEIRDEILLKLQLAKYEVFIRTVEDYTGVKFVTRKQAVNFAVDLAKKKRWDGNKLKGIFVGYCGRDLFGNVMDLSDLKGLE